MRSPRRRRPPRLSPAVADARGIGAGDRDPRGRRSRLDPRRVLSALSASLARRPVRRRRVSASAGHGTALAIACLASYWFATDITTRVHSLARSGYLISGLWSVIATVFVYRESDRESVTAALSRTSATLLSFALCLIYLLIWPFHPLGLAVLIGLGTFLLMAMGRDDDIGIAGITTAVVMVSAATNPHMAWEEPILRLVDTAIGIAIGLGASFARHQIAQLAHDIGSRASLP